MTYTILPSIEGVKGFRASAVHCGLRNRGKLDLALIAADGNCNAAGVFTTSQVKSAPVLYDMDVLAKNAGQIRAVVTNSKIANVCTGLKGEQNTAQMAALVAQEIGCQPDQVLVMSTGIIGAQLPMPKVEKGIKAAAKNLTRNPSGWHEAAMGIMTTDTRLKIGSIQCDGYTLAGIAKGSGMIAPNMATMLSTIVTDAAIAPDLLHTVLKKASDLSFNCITVDGDTSTSDTVLLLASGASGKKIEGGKELEAFQQALTELAQYLAKAIVIDGEGASKFIAIQVEGAPDDKAAWTIGNTIANSPLVKTAFAGSDANWGRIMMAAGRAGITFNQHRTSLWFDYGGDGVTESALQVLKEGQPTDYQEAFASDIFAAHDISVKLQLDEGQGKATIWTCDLTHEYVRINGDYRT